MSQAMPYGRRIMRRTRLVFFWRPKLVGNLALFPDGTRYEMRKDG